MSNFTFLHAGSYRHTVGHPLPILYRIAHSRLKTEYILQFGSISVLQLFPSLRVSYQSLAPPHCVCDSATDTCLQTGILKTLLHIMQFTYKPYNTMILNLLSNSLIATLICLDFFFFLGIPENMQAATLLIFLSLNFHHYDHCTAAIACNFM